LVRERELVLSIISDKVIKFLLVFLISFEGSLANLDLVNFECSMNPRDQVETPLTQQPAFVAAVSTELLRRPGGNQASV
jgi:hypothetical protein